MKKPQGIESAINDDLRGSWLALQRAAMRARRIAMQTGTALVVVRNGVLEHLYPMPEPATSRIQESGTEYKESS